MIARVIAAESEPGADAESVAVGASGRIAVIQLLFRTGLVRLIGIGGTAVLARILLPQDFGIFAIVTFLIGVLGPLSDFGLGAALVQQPDRPSDREFATVFTIQLLISVTLTAIVWVIAPLATVVFPTLPIDSEWMIRVTALVLPLVALRSAPGAMMARVLRFGPLALIEVVQQLVYYSVAIVLALFGAGAWSFILALIAHLTVAAVLVNIAWGGRLRIGIDRGAVRRVVSFGAAFQVTNLLLGIRDAVVPVFGGLAGGLSAIGYLQFGLRLGGLAGSIDDVVGRVAFPAFSRLQAEKERLRRAVTATVEMTGLLVALLLGWAISVAPTLIPFLFSERWVPMVPVFQLVAVGTLAFVPAGLVRGLAFASGNGRAVLTASIATVSLLVVLFPTLLIAFGVAGGGLAIAIYAMTQLSAFVFATRKVVRFPWRRLLTIYGLAALAALGSALINDFLAAPLGLIVSGVAYVAVFGLLLLLFERPLLDRGWRVMRGGDHSVDRA